MCIKIDQKVQQTQPKHITISLRYVDLIRIIILLRKMKFLWREE